MANQGVQVVKVIGICCSSSEIDVVLIEGDTLDDAVLRYQAKHKLPTLDRGDSLRWVRQEILELINRLEPDRSAVRVSEKSGKRLSPERGEVEGIVQEALVSAGVPLYRHYSATVRARLGCQTNDQLEALIDASALLRECPKSRLKPLLSAVALISLS